MQEHSRFVKMKERIFLLGGRLDEAEALAASRLELLRRWDKYREARERPCPFCFEIKHTTFCELKELGDK